MVIKKQTAGLSYPCSG